MVESPAAGAPGSFRWKGSYYWSPGTSHSKGVLVLFKDCLMVHDLPPSGMQDTQGIVQANGRVVRVDSTHCGQPLLLVGRTQALSARPSFVTPLPLFCHRTA